tara:strand:+ start:272 stop:640 length:369 start_codon:yes stop_codon:yes gene_type:complete
MPQVIDNIPNKENQNKEVHLGKQLKLIHPEAFTAKEYNSFKSVSKVTFPTVITSDIDYNNKYNVLVDEKNEKGKKKTEEEEESDDESIDVNEIFKQDINMLFIGALSIIGLFVFYRMIQKSR